MKTLDELIGVYAMALTNDRAGAMTISGTQAARLKDARASLAAHVEDVRRAAIEDCIGEFSLTICELKAPADLFSNPVQPLTKMLARLRALLDDTKPTRSTTMIQPTTATELFDQQLPALLRQHPDQARAIGAVYLFKIAGAGVWTVDLTASPPTVVPSDTGNAQCTMEIASAEFNQILTNPSLAMQFYFQGKLRVIGDPMLATKLQALFRLGR